MRSNDLSDIKKRIYDEDKIEEILLELGCQHVKLVGNRFECGLPVEFGSKNNRAVQVYVSESLPARIRNKGISGDLYSVVGYILYEVMSFDELRECIHQVKAWVCNLFNWDEYLVIQDDFDEIVEVKDRLPFLRDIQKKRKRRKSKNQYGLNKKNRVLNEETAFKRFIELPHKNFLEDGIKLSTQVEFGVMFDMESERVVFPVHNENGELISIKGRYVGNDKQIEEDVKYLYLHNFDKSIELYNYHRAFKYIQEQGEVIVFESEKSCMKAYQYGFKNTVAICGSDLSPIQANMLKKLEATIIFAFDKGIEVKHIEKQSQQIKTRKCFFIIDRLGLLAEDDSPVDKGEEIWKKLYKNCLKEIS